MKLRATAARAGVAACCCVVLLADVRAAESATIVFDDQATFASFLLTSTVIGFEGLSGSPQMFTVQGATFSVSAGNFNFISSQVLFGTALTAAFPGFQIVSVAAPANAMGFFFALEPPPPGCPPALCPPPAPQSYTITLPTSETFSITADTTARFFGVISDQFFNSLTLAPASGFFRTSIDNFQYGIGVASVPEPASLLLLGSGLVVVLRRRVARRRRFDRR